MTTPADDDDDWSGFSQAMRQRSQEKRAANRESSPAALIGAGLSFVSNNAGAHLIVTAPDGRVADFWPGTGKWIVRQPAKTGRGVFNLTKHLKPKEAPNA